MITDGMIDIRLNEMLLAFEKSPDHNFSRFAARRELEREAGWRPADWRAEIPVGTIRCGDGLTEAMANRTVVDRLEIAMQLQVGMRSLEAFIWRETSEGRPFWSVVWNRLRDLSVALRASAEPPKPDPVAVAMKAYDKAVREGCNPRMGSVEAAIRAGIAADREARV
jgi:hypothetical protein